MTENSPLFDKSRSQIKREFLEVKELGVQLAALPKGQLRDIPLSEETRAAILAAHPMTRNALQRHYRYLTSLLMEEDLVAIRAALAHELRPHVEEVAGLHEAERLRDELLSADEERVTVLVAGYADGDRSKIRLLVRNARNERDRNMPPKSARQLFRFLRQTSSSKDPR